MFNYIVHLLSIPHLKGLHPLDLLLELQDAIHQRLSSRRTTRNVNVHGYDSIAATHDGVRVVIIAPAVGTTSHRNDPPRLGHLIVNLPQGWGHLVRQSSGHNDNISLTW